jgi:transposase
VIVIGTDAHKRSHTLVAVDAGGRKRAQKVVEATSSGHSEALRWARAKFGADLLWGVEDCRQVSGRLERDLIGAGQEVVRVPTMLMARTRGLARVRGKSDPIDALAVARAVIQNPHLPRAYHDEVTREFKLLTDRREDLVGQRLSATNRLLWRLHELDPSRSSVKKLQWAKNRAALDAWLTAQPGLVAELARAELADIGFFSDQIHELTKRIIRRVKDIDTSLVQIPGCAELTAAKFIGETAVVTRFRSEAAFARFIGVAPIPMWSGSTAGRVRLSRGGNRQLNKAVHRIAVTQIRDPGPGRTYYERRISEGNSRATALRALKRRISRVVYGRLHADHKCRHREPTPAPGVKYECRDI